mmetsp:Transcript_46663/g.98063  ORF Transcript_46663/g.98063 Transcript_46663/m.98063 type:complete len:355 (+) Transcript_46663:55-1119(+)
MHNKVKAKYMFFAKMMYHHHPLLLLLVAAFLLACTTRPVHAFSSTPPPPPKPDGIKIVGLPGGKIESLPGMYVRSFRRWIVEDDTKTNDGNSNDSSNTELSCKMEPIVGAGLALDEGWVNPTTTSELWWPADLDTLQTRPMLNVLFRNGMLSYVSAGLDVRVPHRGNDGEEEEVVSWRNYGLNSQPIARIWTTLDIAMEKLFHMETFILQPNNSNDSDEEQKLKFDTLFPSLDTAETLNKVATFIAELDSLSPIAEGFHIASFPLMDRWTDLPSPPTPTKTETKEGEVEDTTKAMYKIVSMATSEPFATKMLDMDEDLLVMSSTSVLELDVCRTVKGGESEYLPEPYKPLYLSS